MTETLQRLQDRLSAADRCYRRPHAAIRRNPLLALATTVRRGMPFYSVTYQAILGLPPGNPDRMLLDVILR